MQFAETPIPKNVTSAYTIIVIQVKCFDFGYINARISIECQK